MVIEIFVVVIVVDYVLCDLIKFICCYIWVNCFLCGKLCFKSDVIDFFLEFSWFLISNCMSSIIVIVILNNVKIE